MNRRFSLLHLLSNEEGQKSREQETWGEIFFNHLRILGTLFILLLASLPLRKNFDSSDFGLGTAAVAVFVYLFIYPIILTIYLLLFLYDYDI